MKRWSHVLIRLGHVAMTIIEDKDDRLSHLECFVCIEVQRHSGVREEEVQSSKVEQIIAAHLPGKCFHGPWILNWVQKHNLHAKCANSSRNISLDSLLSPMGNIITGCMTRMTRMDSPITASA